MRKYPLKISKFLLLIFKYLFNENKELHLSLQLNYTVFQNEDEITRKIFVS